MSPSGRKIMAFLVGLLAVDLIVLTFLNRRPVCVESNSLSELEWISKGDERATAFNCKAKVMVPLTKIFIEKLPEIQRRLSQLDNALKSNFLPKRPIKLTIHEGSANLLQLSADSIIMSEDIFFNRQRSLEKAFLKAWIQQNQKAAGLGFLRQEILSHFLLRNLGIQQPTDNEWQEILGRWPHFATSWSGYCGAPDRDESYASLCSSASTKSPSEAFSPFSVYFWFAQNLWNSFQALTVNEQIEFFKKIDGFVGSLSESDTALLNEVSLVELEGFIRTEVENWKKALDQINYSEWGENFKAKVSQDLEVFTSSLGRVDLLVKKDTNLNSAELENLQRLALGETNYRVMAEEGAELWGFPWLVPMRADAFPTISAQHLVWIVCAWPSVESLMAHKGKADKIIVVQECSDKAEPLIYSGLLHRGLQFFSLDNSKAKFILINLAGLDFLANRDTSLIKKHLVANLQNKIKPNYLAGKANWASALWNQRYRAYEVQATVEAVEWFKLPENVWPDFE
jgi:hypothetical protein